MSKEYKIEDIHVQIHTVAYAGDRDRPIILSIKIDPNRPISDLIDLLNEHCQHPASSHIIVKNTINP